MQQQKPFLPRLSLNVALLLISASSFSADEPPAPGTRVFVPVEEYKHPQPKKMSAPSYPHPERERGEQGWVWVQLMIDPKGKPYELEVQSSTGNKEFEKRALKAIESSTFIPAQMGGKPVEAMVMVPVIFSIRGETQARPDFKKNYDSFIALLAADDKSAAESGLAVLKAKNLYEYSYYNLALFAFAQKWGTEREQLVALRAAVAGVTTPQYLEKNAFIFAVKSLFIAEAKAQNYSAALTQWNTLKALEKNPDALKSLEPIAAKIETLKTDPRPYSVKASLPEGSWLFPLYRNKFFIKVLNGHVSTLKLYCEKKYVLFPFDPTLEYKIEDKFGNCSLGVSGDGGTNIELTQMM